MICRICTILFFFSILIPALSAHTNNPSLNKASKSAFIENKGQVVDQKGKPNPGVLYLLNSPGFNVQLRRDGFSYDLYRTSNNDQRLLKSDRNSKIVNRCSIFGINPGCSSHDSNSVISFHRIDFDLLSANPNPTIVPSDPSPDYFNYYGALFPVNGITNVRQYQNITYENIYPGIDLEFMIDKTYGCKYNFIVHPGGKSKDIRFRINGSDGVSMTGDFLNITTSQGDIVEKIPESYYVNGRSHIRLDAHFRKISSSVYGFELDGTIPQDATLVIDPTMARLWGTYYGGDGGESVASVMVNALQESYICGSTSSPNNIATAGSFQSTWVSGYYSGYLAKFTAGGVRLWGTYYCGTTTGTEFVNCEALDPWGNIYITGETNSDTGIATPGAHQTIYPGGYVNMLGFLAKFNPAGHRIWATYYGGGSETDIYGVTTNNSGEVFIAGGSDADSLIASPGAYQDTLYNISSDAFLAKFDSGGTRMWGTYYGGESQDEFQGCQVDSYGNIYTAGRTASTQNISSPGTFQETYGGGVWDAFLVKFNPAGFRIWATYFGGPAIEDQDWGNVTVDSSNNCYLFGETKSSTGIASPGCHQPARGGEWDGFIAKFAPSGQRLWSTYYGGIHDDDIIYGCIGPGGEIYFSGRTASPDNISTPDAYMISLQGGADAMLVKFDSNGVRKWGTYFGGSSDEGAMSVAYVKYDTLYLGGGTGSSNNISTPGSHQYLPGYLEFGDGFLEKFIECWPMDTAGPITGPADICLNSPGIVYSIPPVAHAGTYVWTLPAGATITAGAGTTTITVNFSASASPGLIWVKALNKCGEPGDSAFLLLMMHPRPVPVISGPDTTCSGPGKVYSTAPGKSNYQWSVSPGGVITSGGGATDDFVTVTWNSPGLQTIQVNYTDINGCAALAPAHFNVFVVPGPPVNITINPSANNVCAGTQVTFTATPINGGSNPGYQWKVNGINAGTNSPAYTYNPVSGDLLTCILTSNDTCSSNNPATSNTIQMIVNPLNPVSITISPSANPVCSGIPVTFTSAAMYGGPTPSYQWKVNGVNVGSNLPTYIYNPVSGDLVSCILNSNIICPTGNPAASNTITMIVNPNLPVSVSISASANPFCQGSSVSFTATPSNGGTSPSYQWKVNGIGVGPNNPVYTYSPNNGDIISCVLSSNETCTSNNPASSNQVIMVIMVNLSVSVLISASTNPFCPGNSVTFTATPANGGTIPVYQWKVNGVNAGTNSPAFTYNPASGDLVSCNLTSNLVCVSGNPATSNTIIMSGNLAPVVTFTRCFDSITTTNAKPFKLKGGIPLGGTYSGAGVAGGIFHPAIAGVGNHQINYSYTNTALCSATVNYSLLVINSPAFNCGQNLTDIRDNKVYQTIQIGSQCWFAEDLNYGTEIPSNIHQRDNCTAEKYHNPASGILHPASVYQWDELMNYDESISNQGLCPPAWHVPSEADWNVLFTNYINNGFAASPLKYSGFSGFNALLSGTGHMNKTWDWPGFATFFWSSTSHGTTKAWAHGLNDLDPSVSVYPALRNNAFPVRCLKDN